MHGMPDGRVSSKTSGRSMQSPPSSPTSSRSAPRRASMAEVVSAAMAGKKDGSFRDSLSSAFTGDSDYVGQTNGGLDREILHKRIVLELKMLSMLPRFLLFAVGFLLFIAVQQVEYDPTSFSGIHLRLRDHFQVQDVFGIRQIPELMAYLDYFVIANEQLNPLDIYHWCADEDTIQLPVNRIRCNRDRGQLPDKPFLDHYAVSSQRLQEAQSNALYYMVREIREATVAPSRRMKAATTTRAKKTNRTSRLPRKSHIAVTLRSPKMAQRDAASKTGPVAWVANTSGVVGFALNGVMLVGAHHEKGKAMPTAWHFDNCGGHVDATGHYHYHFPASCFLGHQGHVTPGRADWWAQEDPMAFWPALSKPSPVLGHALDGIPIRGPYGSDGRLVRPSELDECNGRTTTNEQGEKEYHYVWSVSDPFLPPCFKLQPALLKSNKTNGDICQESGENLQHIASPKGEDFWVLRSHGCPDHPYFGEPVKVGAVASVLDKAAAIRKLEACSASSGQASVVYVGGVRSLSGGNNSCGVGCNTGCCAGAASCSTGCSTGCSAGCSTGCNTGCSAGCSTSCSTGCNTGCSAGCSTGCSAGCSAGCNTGCSAGCSAGCNTGCSAGCSAGCSSGCNTGCSAGCSTGCSAGCSTGCSTGCNTGCSAGCSTGCNTGSYASCSGGCNTGSCGAGWGTCTGNCGSCGTCGTCGACGSCGGCWTCVVDIFNPCDAGFGTGPPPVPPKQFIRYKPFSMTASSVGFPFICQSRRVEKDCDSNFVDGYNAQEPNPVYREPMNAPRNSSILRCRGEEYSTEPHLGYSPQVQDGVPYYCVFVSADILAKMMEFEWIDDLTSDVFVASFIYFPNADAISLMRMNFLFADTGRILSETVIDTHSVLQESDRWTIYLILQCAFLALMGSRLSYILVRCVRVKKRRKITYDTFLTAALTVFGVIDFLIRTVSEDRTMAGLLSLVTQIISVDDPTSRETVEKVINGSFQTLSMINATVSQQEMMKIFAYVLVFMCLLRLIQYMEVHPRVDLIARTVKAASGDMFHFCLIFLLIFIGLAWLAHWSFGPDKIMFSSLRTSANTCFQMLIGEYPFEDEWTEGWKQKVWYVLYTFLLFLVSLNILLAIIVESFLRVKKEIDERQEVRSLFPDLFSLCTRRFLAFQHAWPSTLAVMKHLEVHRLERGPVSVKELLMSNQVHFENQEAALTFLKVYHWYLGPGILDAKGREYEASRDFVLSYMCHEHCPKISNKDYAVFIDCVVHIQSVARRRQAYKTAERLRKQKQKQAERRQNALKLRTKTMELKGSEDSVVREFGSWLGINSQVVDALLLMRAAGLGGSLSSGGIVDPVDSVGTQSTSLGEDTGLIRPPLVLQSMERLEEFGDSKTAEV